MIVENTFTSIPDMIDVVLRWLSPFKFLSRNKWSSKDVVGQLTIPILLLSGEKDELVSRPPPSALLLKLTMPHPPPISPLTSPLASALQVPARMMQQLYERSTGSLKRHIIYFAEGFVSSSFVVGHDDLTDEVWVATTVMVMVT